MRSLAGILLLGLLTLPVLPAPPAQAQQAPPQLVPAEGAMHPCTFFRSQAQRMAITHFLTEMHWACQEIAARRAAGMPLTDRLIAAEGALIAFREAVTAARTQTGTHLSLNEARKRELAETTGALAALEAISTGF